MTVIEATIIRDGESTARERPPPELPPGPDAHVPRPHRRAPEFDGASGGVRVGRGACRDDGVTVRAPILRLADRLRPCPVAVRRTSVTTLRTEQRRLRGDVACRWRVRLAHTRPMSPSLKTPPYEGPVFIKLPRGNPVATARTPAVTVDRGVGVGSDSNLDGRLPDLIDGSLGPEVPAGVRHGREGVDRLQQAFEGG